MSERRSAPLLTLLAAALLFRVGNAMATVALPWFVLSRTGSAAWAGATGASSLIATILGAWVGGGLVDRFGRAAIALLSGVVGGVSTAGIPLLHALDALSHGALLSCVVLGAAFDAPGMAAQDSELPRLGRMAGLSVERVSSLKAVMGNIALLAGPALGGAAVGLLGAAPTIGLTAVLSLLAGLLGAWALPWRPAPTAPTSPALSRRAGVAFLWSDPLLRPLLGLVTLFAGLAGANGSVILPALFMEAGRPAAQLGLYFSAMGAGGLVGLAFHALAGARLPPQRWLAAAFAGSAAGSLLLSLVPGVFWLVLLGALVGLLAGPVSPILNAAIYNRTPPQLLGRALGAISAAMMSAAPAAMLAAGSLVELAGPRPGLGVSAALTGVVALLVLRLRFDPVPLETRLPTATLHQEVKADGPPQAQVR